MTKQIDRKGPAVVEVVVSLVLMVPLIVCGLVACLVLACQHLTGARRCPCHTSTSEETS